MSNGIQIVKLGKYKAPKGVVSTNNKYVSYGADNNYYSVLLNAKDSPTNSALINTISDLIYGKGIKASNANRKPNEYAAMKSLFTEECIRRVSEDYYFLGSGTIQLIYNQDKTAIIEAYHSPSQNWRPAPADTEGDNEGEITGYYYSDDWVNVQKSDELTRVDAFGFGASGHEVLIIKPYRSGHFYFSPPEYQSGIEYAFVEIELANYHLNNIKKGFSGKTLINFNNGRPTNERQIEVKNQIEGTYSGSDGDTIVVAFNESKENAATVEDVQISDAHSQYQFIAEEASRKIMVSHRVTSPLLVGLPQNGGLGSNADEIKMAATLFDNTVIKPMQRVILDAIDSVLAVNGVSLNLYFETSQPLEFTNINEEIESSEDNSAEVISQLKAQSKENTICCSKQDDALDLAADPLINLGEDIDLDEWELIDEGEVDYELEEDEQKELSLMSKILNFVSTGTARPNAKSEQDAVIDETMYKVRYRYSPLIAGANSREFCRKMVSADKIYRKEDIVQMNRKSVNAGWGANGANTYDIFKYKGGGGCKHKWMRLTYIKKGTTGSIDANSPKAETISTGKAERAGYRVRNPKEVAMKPVDMPNNGFLKPRG